MKKSILCCVLFFLAFGLFGNTYQVKIAGHIFGVDGTVAAGIVVKYVHHNSDVNTDVIVVRTDNSGHFEILFKTDKQQGCGDLIYEYCNGEVNGEVVCYDEQNNEFKFEFEACHQSKPCFDDLHADIILRDDSLYNIILALPEDMDYDVIWSTGDVGIDIIGLPGVEYCVSITGANCSFTKCFTPGTHVGCKVKIIEEFGIEGGLYLYAETHGQKPIEFHWSNGSSDQYIEARDSGEYCVKVVYADGCIARDCIVVDPDSLWNGNCWAYIYEQVKDDGTRCLAVESYWSGDILTYLWSTGATTSTIVPDSTGTYYVTVTTSSGCSIKAEYFFVAEGDCSVEIIVEGHYDPAIYPHFIYAKAYGNGEITYSWSTGDDDQWLPIYESGDYCVTITDATGCVARDCRYIDIDSLWYGNCNVFIEEVRSASGQTVLQASGRYSPNSTIMWSTGEVGKTIIPLKNGEYCVTVTNGDICKAEACYFYNSYGECKVDVVDVRHEGITYIYPLPYGIPPFKYSWNTGSCEDYLIILESGKYCVTMTDATGCQSRWCGYIEIDHQGFCEAYINREKSSDGHIYYRVYGIGKEPFTYQWDRDYLQGDSVVLDKPGIYCVTVTDVTGCAVSTCVEIPNPNKCHVEIDYTVGFAGDTILYAIVKAQGDYKIYWDTGEEGHEIKYPYHPVCVKIITEDGCVAEACFEGFPNDKFYTITGMVSDPVLDHLIYPERISLYKYNSDSMLVRAGAEIEIIDNIFIASVKERGQYLVKADVDGYIPTYYRSAVHWQDAIWIAIDEATVAVVYEILMVRETEVDGNGIVSGNVIGGNNVTFNINSYRSNEGFADAGVLVTTLDGKPLLATYTNENGEFKLAGLPAGQYYIVLEVPGYPQERILVAITEDQPHVGGVNFELNLAEADSTTGIHDKFNKLMVSLFPNPTTDRLSIQLIGTDIENETLLTVLNMHGKVLKNIKYQHSYDNIIELDVSNLPAGAMYHLQVSNGGKTGIKRFVKVN